MRYLFTTPMLAFVLFASACGGGQPSDTPKQSSSSNNSTSAAKPDAASPGGTGAVSVSSSHGGSDNPGAQEGEKPPVATTELDAKVEKAEAKAKAASASAEDKKAAVEAYMERGNFFYNAGDKRLYRYALGDFRRALRYEPDNAEAKEKIEMIESIYKSLGRPVPTNGLEP